ncbi:MAG: DNA polymerase III subunit gamma/tau [Clostridia bacterium]|nr:DNA polymerase III subunit gamma/tau [Clostridia bacterium]
MSYQVLYRAWRPGTFSEICGQDAVVRTLRRQVLTDRIAHAYLFCGTRGTGKTTASKVLAKAINCLHPNNGDPCGECEVCQALQAENCMDVVEIDAASNNGVDEIRDLREKIKYPPSVTKYKVYIIDEVHMLSTGAFNALLKTLEEPPKHAVFILATTEPQKLPATILSRCQRFDFHRISVETIVDRMMVVLGGIGREAEDDALYEIARAAEGAMRDALSLLDCCLSYTDGAVTLQLARDVLGTAGRAFMFDFADALIDFDTARTLMLINEMMNKGCDPQVFMRDTVAHLRGLMLAAAVGDIADLLEITPEDSARFVEQSKRIDSVRLARLMDLFMRAEPDMKWATRPRTVLELAAVRACHPEDEKDSALTERMARMEKLLENGVAVAPAPAKKAPEPAPAPAEAPKPAPVKAAPAVTPPPEYHSALDKVAEDNPSIRAALPSMRFTGFDGSVVSVEFSKKTMMHLKMLERKKTLFDAALSDAFGQPVSIRMTLEGEKAAPKTASVAKRVIEESYDVFGRDKIDLSD